MLLRRTNSITEVGTGRRIDAGRIGEEIARRASVLSGFGVAPGKRVAILHGGTIDFFADLFAIWRCGGCALVINPKATAFEIGNILAASPVAAILTDGKPRELSAGPVLCLRDEKGGGQGAGESRMVLDDEALILYTSGTTGEPKGVVHTFRSLLARVALNQQFISAEETRTALCILPTHFGHGLIGNCLTTLANGGELCLFAPSGALELATLAKIVAQHHITFFSSVPSAWKVILASSGKPERGVLRRVSIGSAPLSAEMWRAAMEWSGTDQVVNVYGITETANWICGASAREFEPEDGLIGRMWGGEARVLGPDGELADGGEGELAVQTPALMKTYDRQPELTAAVLRGGWFYTGDQGSIDDRGCIRLTGRLKYQINYGGMKIQPEDIDLLLEKHEWVHEACAFGVPDPIAGEVAGVAVVFSKTVPVGEDEAMKQIKAWSAERLNSEKLPRKWFLLDEIPKTDRGKLNRNVVAEACAKMRVR